MTNQRATIIWQDAQGEQVVNLVNTSSGASSIETQMLALSNAVLVETTEGNLNSIAATPATSQYISVRQVAVLIYRDSRTGSTGRLFIPSPKAGLFMAGDTVNPADVAALNAVVLGNLLAGSGNTVDTFVGGYLSAPPRNALGGTAVVAFQNPMIALGDMIYANDSAGDAARLPIGTSGEILTVSAGVPTWAAAGGIHAVTWQQSVLGADQALTASSWVDVLTISLVAGTYILWAALQLENTSLGDFLQYRLYDGTTVIASGETTCGTANQTQRGNLGGIQYAPSGSVTLHLQGNCTTTGSKVLAAMTHNGVGNNATYVGALKIA